jgi:hypothetical protein
MSGKADTRAGPQAGDTVRNIHTKETATIVRVEVVGEAKAKGGVICEFSDGTRRDVPSMAHWEVVR